MNDLTTAELRAIDFALSQQITLARDHLRHLHEQGLDTAGRDVAAMLDVMSDARSKIRAIPFPPDPPDDPPAD